MIQYGMFSDHGNELCGRIVSMAKEFNLTWPEVYTIMQFTADVNPGKVGEIMDTFVREKIYDACGFDTEFYI